MKKKFLSLIFAICLIIPCIFFMAACVDDPPPTGPQSPVTGFGFSGGDVNVYLRDINATSPQEEYIPTFNGGTNEFSIWLSDDYNRDTLKLFLNGEEIEWVKLEDPDYDNRKLTYMNDRKVGTLTLTDLKGNIEITATCEEEEITLKFAPQVIEEEKLEILDEFKLVTQNGGNETRTSFKTIAQNGFTLKSTYSQLVDSENGIDGIWTKGILVESTKKIGYYNHTQMIVSQSENVFAGWSARICGQNKYQSYLTLHETEGFDKEINLTFNADEIEKSTLSLVGLNTENSIMSANFKEWPVDFNIPITISLNSYPGVNFENAKALIYDTEIPFQNVGGNYQITIPVGTLPMDYFDNAKEEYNFSISPNSFWIALVGVDIQNSSLHKMSVEGVDFTGIAMNLHTAYYSEEVTEVIDGLIYNYIVHYYKHNETVTEGLIFTSTNLRPETMILRQKIDGNWVDVSVNISSFYELDPNEHPSGEYVVNNVLDGVDVVVEFMWGQLYSINLRFNIKYETQILPGLN